MWSSFPLPTPFCALANPYLSENMAQGFAAAVPCHMVPYNHCVLINSLGRPYSNGFSPNRTRKYLLNRSIFDLVRAHKVLELTDQLLLSWYLALQVADRKLIQEEGGFRLFLRRHPAFEVTHQHVYMKFRLGENTLSRTQMLSHLDKPGGAMFNQAALLESGGATSGPAGAQRGSLDLREVECLPNTVRESLDLLDHNGDAPAVQPVPWNSKDQGWQAGSGNPALYDGSSTQASFSLDAELEHNCHCGAPWQALQSPPSQAQHCDPYGCAEASCSYYSDSAGEHKEFYTLASSQPFTPQLNHSAAAFAMEPERDSSAPARSSELAWCVGSSPGRAQPAGVSSPLFSRGADSRGVPVRGSVSTCRAGGPGMDREESSEFHSFLEEDKNTVVCKSSGKPEAGEGRDGSTVERGTSPPPRIVTCDVSVGMETRRVSVDAQTEVPATADKNHLTVLHMADLDYLYEEFVKLKSTQSELHELKQRLKSSAEAGERHPCAGCGGRAQRAELRLLALQYTMCQQHAWRDGFTSPDPLAAATTTHPEPQDSPARLVSVCQKLQCDYKEMRTKILAGVSLEQLEPLSVSSARLTSGSPYTPPQLIGDALEDVATGSRPLERGNTEMRGGNESPLCPESDDPTEAKGQEAPVAPSKVNRGSTVTLMPKQSGTDNRQTGARVTGAVASASQGDSTEFGTGEAWYDAKEDLEPDVVVVPTGPADIPSGSDDGKEEGLPKEVAEQESSLLCVSGLPQDVTESDVMRWFEKDHVSAVRLCTFSNHLIVAMVTVNGPLAAEAAVGKMNGICVQGSTLHVERVRAETERSGPAQQPPPTASSHTPEETGGAPRPRATDTGSSLAVGKVPGVGPDKHALLSPSPTAEGTCVPQHYATMGSLDKLMAALKQRHPVAGRPAIVAALQEVRARHRGVLSGLPLASIVEMASEQLTASSSGATAASGGGGGGRETQPSE